MTSRQIARRQLVLLLLLLFGTATIGHAQIQVTRYPSGRVYIETEMRDGQPHGMSREYSENGGVTAEIPHANGVRHGVIKEYYPSGILSAEVPAVEGERHGFARWYYENRNLKQEIPYVDGAIDGIQRHPPSVSGKYRGRELSMPPRLVRQDVDRNVPIFRGEELERFRVTADAEGNLVYVRSGRRVNTQPGLDGIFVMDIHGNVYLHELRSAQHVKHSSLAGGRAIAAAAAPAADRGVLTWLESDGAAPPGRFRPRCRG